MTGRLTLPVPFRLAARDFTQLPTCCPGPILEVQCSQNSFHKTVVCLLAFVAFVLRRLHLVTALVHVAGEMRCGLVAMPSARELATSFVTTLWFRNTQEYN